MNNINKSRNLRVFSKYSDGCDLKFLNLRKFISYSSIYLFTIYKHSPF